MDINGNLIDRDVRRKRERASKHRNKLRAIEYLGGECKDCGITLEDVPMCCFDIDHTIAENKRYHFASIMKSWKRVKKEIDNCDCELVCKNCHAIRTRDQAADPKIKKERQKNLIRGYRNQHNREEIKTMKSNAINIPVDGWEYEIKMIKKVNEEKEETPQATLMEWS